MANNNIGYIENASVLRAANNANGIAPDPALKIVYKGTSSLFYNIYNRDQYSFSTGSRVMGPSFVVNLKSGHSFGLFTGARMMLASHNLPYLVNPNEFNFLNYNKTFTIDPFKVAGLIWSEIGLNYAFKIGGDTEGGLTVGANVKYMQGYQGFFLNNYKGTAMTETGKDTFRIDAVRATTGFTTNYDNNPTHQNGSGLGFDLGVVLTTEGGDDKPYTWRLGASLLDLGKMTMTANAEVHSFNSTEAFQLDNTDFGNIDATNPRADVLDRVGQKIVKKTPTTQTGSAFEMGMPSALQLQADYAFTKNLFLNGLLMQRLPISEVVLERDNIMAVTPRYESRWLGASMPIIVTNWQQMRVGFNARLAFLTLGTDNLGSFMGMKKLSGTDFYLALKINPFTIGFLEGRGGKWGKKVSCYRF